MAGVVVPSLTVTSRMAVRLAGVELELVPAPGETEVHVYSALQLCGIITNVLSVFNEISW